MKGLLDIHMLLSWLTLLLSAVAFADSAVVVRKWVLGQAASGEMQARKLGQKLGGLALLLVLYFLFA